MKPAAIDAIAVSLASVGGAYVDVAGVFKHQNALSKARRASEPDLIPGATFSRDTPPRG